METSDPLQPVVHVRLRKQRSRFEPACLPILTDPASYTDCWFYAKVVNDPKVQGVDVLADKRDKAVEMVCEHFFKEYGARVRLVR